MLLHLFQPIQFSLFLHLPLPLFLFLLFLLLFDDPLHPLADQSSRLVQFLVVLFLQVSLFIEFINALIDLHFNPLDETLVYFITVVFDERVFSYLLPVWPFVGLKDYQEFYEVIGLVGGRMAIDSLWFWVFEQSFGLYLLI